MKDRVKLGLDKILEEIALGSNPSQICKKYGIVKQTLDYSVNKLKKLGCIEKKGYGVWIYVKEVPKVPKDTKKGHSDFKKQIRGHAFIWKIKFYDPIIWGMKLKNSSIKFSMICRGKVFRIIFENRKIWLTKDGMIIYEPIDFMGDSSFQVKGQAVYNMDRIVKKLMKRLKIQEQKYKFTTSREHYGIVRNELAKQYNERKEKMQIRGEDGTVWMWIDDSLSLGELENNEPVVNRQVQNFWNDNKKHDFGVTPSFILNGFDKTSQAIKKNAEHLEFHAENMRTHVKAVQDLGAGVKKLTKIIKELKK